MRSGMLGTATMAVVVEVEVVAVAPSLSRIPPCWVPQQHRCRPGERHGPKLEAGPFFFSPGRASPPASPPSPIRRRAGGPTLP